MTNSHYTSGDAHMELDLHSFETDTPIPPIPPEEWPVPGLFAPGVTLLTGPASSGKSWFAQQLAFSIADGETFLGHFPTRQGTTLHISFLSDMPRLLSRSYLLRGGRSLPRNYHFTTSWKPTADTAPFQPLRDFLHTHADTRLIILDHLTALQAHLAAAKSACAEPLNLLNELKELAYEYKIMILVLDRNRPKTFSSQCDAHIQFQPLVSSLDLVSMDVRSQEADAQLHYLTFDTSTCRPTLATPADTVAVLKPSPLPFLTPERHAILDILYAAAEALTPAEIAARLNKDENAVRQLIFKLSRAQLIVRPSYGRYTLSDLARRYILHATQQEQSLNIVILEDVSPVEKEPQETILGANPQAPEAHIAPDNTDNATPEAEVKLESHKSDQAFGTPLSLPAASVIEQPQQPIAPTMPTGQSNSQHTFKGNKYLM